jgi:hypothetical protein
VRERLVSQRTGIISDPRLSPRARHRRASRAPLPPRRPPQDPGGAVRCPVTPYGANHRGSRRRLAAAR